MHLQHMPQPALVYARAKTPRCDRMIHDQQPCVFFIWYRTRRCLYVFIVYVYNMVESLSKPKTKVYEAAKMGGAVMWAVINLNGEITIYCFIFIYTIIASYNLEHFIQWCVIYIINILLWIHIWFSILHIFAYN